MVTQVASRLIRWLRAAVPIVAAAVLASSCNGSPAAGFESLDAETEYLRGQIMAAIEAAGGTEAVASVEATETACEISPGVFSHRRVSLQVELEHQDGLVVGIAAELAQQGGGSFELVEGRIGTYRVISEKARFLVARSAGSRVVIRAVTGCYP